MVRTKDFLDEYRSIVIGRADEVKAIIDFADFASGAMIQNLVVRAQKTALKRALAWRRGACRPGKHDGPMTPVDYFRHPRPCAPVCPCPTPHFSSLISW